MESLEFIIKQVNNLETDTWLTINNHENMNKILLFLISLIGFSCSKDKDPFASGKLAGTTWVAEYSTNPSTGEILYDGYRLTTNKDVLNEGYYQETKIISSVDLTYKYDPPRLLLAHDGGTRMTTKSQEMKSSKVSSNTSDSKHSFLLVDKKQ